jgi:hypothetical protein
MSRSRNERGGGRRLRAAVPIVVSVVLAWCGAAAAPAQQVDVKLNFSQELTRDVEGSPPTPESTKLRKTAERANAKVVRDWLADNFRYWDFQVADTPGAPAVELKLSRAGQLIRMTGELRIAPAKTVPFFKPIDVGAVSVNFDYIPRALADRLMDDESVKNQQPDLLKLLMEYAPVGTRATWDGQDGQHSLVAVNNVPFQVLSPCEIMIETYDANRQQVGWIIGYLNEAVNGTQFKAFHSDWAAYTDPKRQPIMTMLAALPWKNFVLEKVFLLKEIRSRLRPVEE